MISVIMPCFNCKDFVRESIESIFQQSNFDIEIVIVDDGSLDGSLEYIKSLFGDDERFIFYQNPQNLGVAKTRNKAFTLCHGEYIAFLDSDDVWENGKLQIQLDVLLASHADICCTGARVISNDGVKLDKFRFVDEVITFESMLRDNMVVNSSVIMRREVMERVKFSSDFFHEDYVFWLECLRDNFKIVGINEPLTIYRLGGRSQNKLNAARHRLIIYRKFLGFGIVKSIKYMFYYAKKAMAKQ